MSQDSTRKPTPEWIAETERIREDERKQAQRYDDVSALERHVGSLANEMREMRETLGRIADRLAAQADRTDQTLEYIAERLDAERERERALEARVAALEPVPITNGVARRKARRK